jgi:serine/threonine-protein kinase
MDLRRWPQADELIERALALPARDRQAFVQNAAGGDAALCDALLAILREIDAEDRFLAPGGALTGPVFVDLQQQLTDASGVESAFEAGDTIGPYRIVDQIGRGGMGEVYRGLDTSLGREVALKVLPERLADDPQRLARFEREARLLAALDHPNVAALYGVERTPQGMALVLELVEGPTLAARIAHGALPMDRALELAAQIADALDAAHERGIVHRDLKPANVKIAPDGTVRVLDFGLAKALEPANAEDEASPGLTTVEGHAQAVMGTPAYMSPEQVRGEPADRRTDVWAFGCVLYEMLTGARAFSGETTTEIFARVLEREPDLSRLPASAPPSLRRLLRRSFEKNPRRRLGAISDARLDVEDARAELRTPPEPHQPPSSAAPWGRALAAAVGLTLGMLAAILYYSVRDEAPRPVTRLAVPIPASDRLIAGRFPDVSISPDGRLVAYRAVGRDGVERIYRRALDDQAPAPIPGTERGTSPFFSPDGRWIGFERDGTLMKVALAGGPPVVLVDAPGGVTANWGRDGAIHFASGTTRVVQRVPEGGGATAAVTSLESPAETAQAFPHLLPGGRTLLLTSWKGDAPEIVAFDMGSRVRRTLTAGRQPTYVESGHLVFVRDGSLWAAPFDGRAAVLAGEPVPLIEGIEASTVSGNAQYAISASGSLLYVPRGQSLPIRSLVWVDRSGREEPVPLEPRSFNRFSLSPDGTRIAVSIAEQDSIDLWVYALDRGTLTRLTFDRAADTAPVWSPDSRAIVFRSEREGGGLFVASPDGSGGVRRLTQPSGPIHTPYSFTPDGRRLLFTEFRSYRDQGIGIVPMDGSAPARLILDDAFAELRPQVSPDGRWLAYQSNESGRLEVFVRPFPNVGARRWQISRDGGTSPMWNPAGHELFYEAGGVLHRVAIAANGSFGLAERVMPLPGSADALGPVYSVSPDARRFLVMKPGERQPSGLYLMLVANWVEEIRQRLR